jgi:hypothetical protein
MMLPIAGVGIEFEISAARFTLHVKGDPSEIRAGAGIPSAEIGDLDFLAVGGRELRAEGSGKPQALPVELRPGLVEAGQRATILHAAEDRVAKTGVAICQRERRVSGHRRGGKMWRRARVLPAQNQGDWSHD